MSSVATRVVYRSDSEFDKQGNGSLQFRLTYEGILHPSSNGAKRGEHKHTIRRQFHPQLKRLWEVFPQLKKPFPLPDEVLTLGGPLPSDVIERLAENRPLGRYRFVPLVTEELSLWCGLDILFLRPGGANAVYKSGDLDNRIKTIVDALKRPTMLDEIGDNSPVTGEDPFYCLLDDDSLVAKLSVEADELLQHIGGGVPNDKDARLVITVTIRPSRVQWNNLAFG
jgi:hypothetical protein